MKNHQLIFITIILFLLLAGCKIIDKDQAEWAAMKFVKERVLIFNRENNNVSDINYSIAQSQLNADKYNFIISISGIKEGKAVSSNISVVVNGKDGKIINFNGKDI